MSMYLSVSCKLHWVGERLNMSQIFPTYQFDIGIELNRLRNKKVVRAQEVLFCEI